jgi:hypothetical protein
MIDISQEEPVSLNEICKLLPPGRNGKRPTLGCVLRWIQSGAPAPDGSRVRLRAGRIGGRWFSSVEAVNEFIAALTPEMKDRPKSRTRRQRQSAADRTDRELTKIGV